MVCRNGLFGQLVFSKVFFHFFVGRSVFRSVGQADGSCLDGLFMLAAVWMHLKMKRDSLVKALPAYLMLTACVFLVFD